MGLSYLSRIAPSGVGVDRKGTNKGRVPEEMTILIRVRLADMPE